VPFFIDPIGKDGKIVENENSNNTIIGFLAEASFVGAGFENYYDNPNIEEVRRYLSNKNLESQSLKLEKQKEKFIENKIISVF
jgi:hypothetical protein